MGPAETVVVLLHLLISGTIGLIGLFAADIYLFAFFTNLPGMITIDKSPEWHHPPQISSLPILNNLLLVLAFSVQHSAMPRGPLKAFILHFIPEQYYTNVYSLASSFALMLIFYCWHPMPTIIWDVQQPTLWYLIVGLNGLSWLGLVMSMLTLDPLDLVGIKKPLGKLLGWPDQMNSKMVDSGPYRLVRHPMYTSLMLALWITPTLTVGHFLLSSVFTTYMVFATVIYEEPKLVEKMGPEYVQYMKRTPRFIPNLPSLGQKTSRD